MAKRIVILGSGIGGAQAIKELHPFVHNNPNYSLTIIDKNNYSTFVPMLHEVATGSISPLNLSHPIREIIHCCQERFLQTTVTSIDIKKKEIQTSDGKVNYDYLISSLGSVTNFFNVEGAKEHAFNLKNLQQALTLRHHIIDCFEQAIKYPKGSDERLSLLHFVIVGAGYTGVETAGQLAELFAKEFKHLYGEISSDEIKITIVHSPDRVVPMLSEKSSKKALERLQKLGVTVLTKTKAIRITANSTTLSTQEVLKTKTVIWSSGVYACGDMLFDKELLYKGRVKVNEYLQIPNHPEAFIIGDLSAMEYQPNLYHPQTAQVAVQQAKSAIKNLKRIEQQKSLKPFIYKHQGDLIPIGHNWAIAEVFGLKFYGIIAFWLRRFVYLKGLYSVWDRIRVSFEWIMNSISFKDTTKF